jgi:hypothetical protein
MEQTTNARHANENNSAIPSGTKIAGGRFVITKPIGKGSFGEIFQGIDT